MRWHRKTQVRRGLGTWLPNVAMEYLFQGKFRISLDGPRAIGGSGAESKPGSCMIRRSPSSVDLSDQGHVEEHNGCVQRSCKLKLMARQLMALQSLALSVRHGGGTVCPCAVP